MVPILVPFIPGQGHCWSVPLTSSAKEHNGICLVATSFVSLEQLLCCSIILSSYLLDRRILSQRSADWLRA